MVRNALAAAQLLRVCEKHARTSALLLSQRAKDGPQKASVRRASHDECSPSCQADGGTELRPTMMLIRCCLDLTAMVNPVVRVRSRSFLAGQRCHDVPERLYRWHTAYVEQFSA
jgi:hypothetical protein